MKAQIITIGDELLSGLTLNTNAAFIGEKLNEIHVQITQSSVVGDNEETIMNEFSQAFNENDIVLVTGGLGPTHDDLTRSCIVKFFNTELIRNDEVLNDIKDIFEKRGRELTPANEDQAMVTEIADVIRNSKGTDILVYS